MAFAKYWFAGYMENNGDNNMTEELEDLYELKKLIEFDINSSNNLKDNVLEKQIVELIEKIKLIEENT